jgi:transposase
VAEGIEAVVALDDFEVLAATVTEGVLEVRVQSTFPRACWHCGSTAVSGHGRHERRVRDCSRGYRTVLVWEQRRLRCSDCGRTSRERHPSMFERRSITRRFRQQLFEEACGRPFSEVATAHGVTAYRVVEAFDALAPAALADIGSPTVLAMDECAFRKRLRFQTVLFDPIAHTALAVVEGRDQLAAERLLFGLSAQVRAGVTTVVIDCHWPFRKAINEAIPHAAVVADRFHVQRSIDTAAQRIRQQHGRKPRTDTIGRDGGTSRQHNPRHDPAVYRARWAFMRRAHHLTDGDRAELDAIFTAHPSVAAAWMMKEAFASIYNAADRADAEHRLEAWEHNLAHADGLTEIRNAWRTLQRWRQEILNHFDSRYTNGFAEGVTNKVKVMKRRGYGYQNPRRYGHKVLLTIGRRQRA